MSTSRPYAALSVECGTQMKRARLLVGSLIGLLGVALMVPGALIAVVGKRIIGAERFEALVEQGDSGDECDCDDCDEITPDESAALAVAQEVYKRSGCPEV